MRRPLLLASVFVVLLTSGCRTLPAPERTLRAERAVLDSSAAERRPLNAKVLNEHFLAKRGQRAKRSRGIYEVSGVVSRVRVERASPEKPECRERFEATIYLPDYAAVEIDCHFTPRHVDRLEDWKPGQWVTLRGRADFGGLRPLLFGRSFELNGCVPEPAKESMLRPRLSPEGPRAHRDVCNASSLRKSTHHVESKTKPPFRPSLPVLVVVALGGLVTGLVRRRRLGTIGD